ncbi:carbamoyltransferase C-terminal domain-containing protein [Magnetococcales bacterium HHB-1]
MKNGYYLSSYSFIGDLAYLKSISLRHDQSLSLWRKDGDQITLVHFWELERISGYKHHSVSFYDTAHAQRIINHLLGKINLSLDDIIEVWGTPGLSHPGHQSWQGPYSHFPHHSVMHLFSSLLLDSQIFNNHPIIALAVDGGPDRVIDYDAGDKNYYVGGYSNHGKIELFSTPSPGVLWALMRLRYGINEGSLMALGSASRSEAHLCTLSPPPVFNKKDIFNLGEWFDHLADHIEALNDKDVGVWLNGFDGRFSVADNRISMMVKIIHRISIKMMEQTIDGILQRFQLKASDTYLALSGGYALNCPTNTHLMHKYGFRGFIAPPCANDSGLSLGIGLYAFHSRLKSFNFRLSRADHGDRDENLQTATTDSALSPFIKDIAPVQIEQAVDDLLQTPTIWFDGRAEMGPRALGHRSLLADPRTLESRDRLNHIKQRQWWRPVAPIILEEYLDDWFEAAFPSPFMLHTFNIKAEKRHQVPAIRHLDESARVQTVNQTDNPMLYQLLTAFHQRTGVPILCNTSLNDRGEPIINSIGEALNFALRKRMQVVYVNQQRVMLKDMEAYRETSPAVRDGLKLFKEGVADPQAMEKRLNAGQLSRYQLIFYYHNPRLHRYDPGDPADADKIRRMIDRIRRQFQHRADFQFLNLWHFVEHNRSGPLD